MKNIYSASRYLPQSIDLAGELATKFLIEVMPGLVLQKKRFTYTKYFPSDIQKKLTADLQLYLNFNSRILLQPIVPKNKNTSMTATTFRSRPGEIYFNALTVHLADVWELVRTLVHEFCHLCGFGHGSNYFQGTASKRNSLPIWLGDQAEEWARKELINRHAEVA